jgi:glycosyltransferase involved in cell wall biosynthesis
MRRVLVSIYLDPEFYPPTKNAIFELASQVDKVYVLTRNMFITETNTYPQNVRFVRIGSYMTVHESQKINLFQKLVAFIRYWVQYHYLLVTKMIDTVICYDSIPLLVFYLGIKPKSITFWYHNHDMPDAKLSRKYSIGWFSAIFEHSAMKKVKYFSLPSKDRLVYYPNWTRMEDFFYIPNYPRLSQFKNIEFKKRFDDFTLIFQGHVGPGHHLEDVIIFLRTKPEIKLIVVGSIQTEYRNLLLKLANKYLQEGQLQILGRIEYGKLLSLTAKCHLGLAIYNKTDEYAKTVGTASNKIYEYLSCGLPIVVFENNQFRKYLKNDPFVFYFNGQEDSLYKIIREVQSDFEKLSLLAKAAFFEKYSFEKNFQLAIAKILSSNYVNTD